MKSLGVFLIFLCGVAPVSAQTVDAASASTWNISTAQFIHERAAITDTASAPTSLLSEFSVNGAVLFSINKKGQVGIGRSHYDGATLILQRSVNSPTTENGIHNSLNQSGNGVAYAIENSLVHSGAISAAAFNNKVITSGPYSRDHVVATQNSSEHQATGTLNWLYGSVNRLFTIPNAGTVTHAANLVALSPVFWSPVTTSYGLYVEDQVESHVTNPWAIYTEGNAPSKIGGPIYVPAIQAPSGQKYFVCVNDQGVLTSQAGACQ